MTDKTRGRASKVDLLPAEIKSQLTMMLRDKKLSQAKILAEINQLVLDAGLGESHCLSRSGLNRFSTRMEQMSSRIRESREMAEIWTKQFGEAPQSDVGKMLMEFIKQLAFETTMTVGESEDGVDIKALNQLALVVQRVEQAETSSFKREQAIRKEVALEAAETAEKAVSDAGLSADTVAMIKRQILGISDD
ncbi:DUF3486 family protein [Psychrobacter sp. HD31]|uniref:DUF3486 family protein n=1 Tax=Psychrobacter sp. HD31 TaxID=3112003 RepID=UPI003DA674D2